MKITVREFVTKLSYALDEAGLNRYRNANSIVKRDIQQRNEELRKSVTLTRSLNMHSRSGLRTSRLQAAEARKAAQAEQQRLNIMKKEVAQARVLGATLASVRNVMFGVTMAFGYPVIRTISTAINAWREVSRETIGMEILSGDPEKAKNAIQELRMLAKETPLTLEETTRAANSLVAAGLNIDKVPQTVRMLGDLAKGNAEVMGRLSHQYMQAMARGRPMWDEIRRFGEAGVPLLQALADELGVTTEEIIKLSRQGKLRFSDMHNAMVSMVSTGGRFHKLMSRIMGESFAGKVDMFLSKWQYLITKIGESLAPVASLVFGVLSFFIDILSAFPKPILAIIGVVSVLSLGLMFLTLAISGAGTALVILNANMIQLQTQGAVSMVGGLRAIGTAAWSLLATTFPALATSLSVLSLKLKQFWVQMGPIGWAILGITTVVTGVMAWKNARSKKQESESSYALSKMDVTRPTQTINHNHNINMKLDSKMAVESSNPEVFTKQFEQIADRAINSKFRTIATEIKANTSGGY